MAKDRRRQQLMRVALDIVREEGTEALTLARLAERAGVTKPIAYEHFGTRAGLLVALFRDHDERTTQAVRAALATGGTTLESVASILSTAYVDACLSMGPEINAIFDALSASEETQEFKRSWRDFLVSEFRTAFAPFMKQPRRQSTALLVGILGAAESLSEAAAAGRLTRAEAIGALMRIMVSALKPASLRAK
ncbi:MAG: TetR family transcriptional regulator [Rhodospirillales bacterium]|nr:TetR family transcriptional regulator [Rhodospirillales bacterium]